MELKKKIMYPFLLVDAMIVSHFPHGPTLYLSLHNVALRHDIASYNSSTVSEQYPHLIFENFSSKLGERIRDILKFLFPVPKEDSKRVMTFSNENDFISFRWVHTHVRFRESNSNYGNWTYFTLWFGRVDLASYVYQLTCTHTYIFHS